MKFFRDAPIKRKLILIMLLSSSVALFIASTSFMVYDLITFRERLKNDLMAQAEIIARNSTAALAFNDSKAADRTLATLAVRPHVVAAALYTENGTLFAAYRRPGVDAPLLAKPGPDGYQFSDNDLVLFQPVMLEKRIGTIYIRYDQEEINSRIRLYSWIAAIVLCVSLLAVLGLSSILQRSISQPVLTLVETARKISTDKDYSLRVRKESGDEIGLLMDNFNTMLAEIQQRDKEVQERERRYRFLAESMPQIVWTANADGKVDYHNQSAVVYYGVAASQLDGFGWLQHVHVDDQERTREIWTSRVRSGEPYEIEHRLNRNDGAHRWHITRALALRGADGQIVKWFGTSTDIDDKKRAEEELLKLNAELEERVITRTKQLEAANKDLESFSYSVSHDLRAPLRSIDGFSRILQDTQAGKLDPTGQDYLRRVRLATQRMGQIIDDMLMLSRVTRSEMRSEDVDLSDIARLVASEFQQREPDRNVEFVIADGIHAQADERLMRIVIDNLLGNAWKFTSKRDLSRIEFGMTHIDDKPVYYIRDNGAGFDMAYRAKLFSPFQRLHSSAEFPGTGIGLAIVDRIIRRHGGQIWAEGVVDQGATFYFRI